MSTGTTKDILVGNILIERFAFGLNSILLTFTNIGNVGVYNCNSKYASNTSAVRGII